jgi:hypothetical protein
MFYSECAFGYQLVRNASTIQNWVIRLIDTSVQGGGTTMATVEQLLSCQLDVVDSELYS